MSSQAFNKARAKAAVLALYRLANPAGGDPPAGYLDMNTKDLNSTIANYLGIQTFDGNKDSICILAAKFGVHLSNDMTNVQVLLAIDEAVKRVWEAKDPTPTVKFGGEGRLDDVIMESAPLPQGIGMDPVQFEMNFLISRPNISKEEFGRRAAALVALPGFDTRYTSMLQTAHLNCEAFHPSSQALKLLQTGKKIGEASKVVTAQEALNNGGAKLLRAEKIYRTMAAKIGFEIPSGVAPYDTCDAAMKHCDEIIASAADPAIIAMNAESDILLAEFEAMGLLDED
jgi:hypothetical protein